MKYICKENCYARNPQGVFQRFNSGDEADFGDVMIVPAHFKKVDGGSGNSADSGIKSERDELIDKLKDLGIAFSPKDSVPKLRKLMKEADL
ncbi:hypothetical protein SAMN05660337_1997 [Maridesulfovibrio ferrireducens]|uniref:Uncharacterized protein n=1 Tax=Maridesulfovibrio ferrireducens TaxID=246191 RepID=A0A1G9H3Z3_9BACT|nr:hypothetical protein [Maridesulfovibrio ferrireducens]SDL07641.1 hypothetical protein SAMN05660337_1997 [Maridesulfovibrio ferrireducens]